MDYREEQLAAQIRAIVTAGETDTAIPERALTLDELKELAISMGLNEEQWQELLRKAEKHLKLADDHLKARNFKDAILEGEQAIAINPYLENCNAILAKAYLQKWLTDHLPESREKAEYHARKELVVDPRDQQAVMILSTIHKKAAVLEQDSSSRKRILVWVGAGVLAVILLIFFFVSLSSANRQQALSEQEKAETDRIKNELIAAEEDVSSKWDLIQVAIDQRNNMIPDLFRAVQTAPAEMAILDSTIQSLQVRMTESSGAERIQLETQLDEQINEAKKLVSQYGDASATEKLLIQIEGSENRIAFEKKNYNEAVKNYNILVKQHADRFPQFTIKPYYNEQ